MKITRELKNYFQKAVSVFSLAALLLVSMPSFDVSGANASVGASCGTTSYCLYVDSTSGVDNGHFWGSSHSDAFKTIQAAIDEGIYQLENSSGGHYTSLNDLIVFVDDQRTAATEKIYNSTATDTRVMVAAYNTASIESTYVITGQYLTIQDFTFDNGGVKLGDSSFGNVNIFDNTFNYGSSMNLYGQDHYGASSYYLNTSYNHLVYAEHNTFTDSGVLIDGLSPGRAMLISNEFSGNFVTADGMVTLDNSGGLELIGNDFSNLNNIDAVRVYDSSYATIMSNTFSMSTVTTGAHSAVFVKDSDVPSFTNNEIDGFTKGFIFDSSAGSAGSVSVKHIRDNQIVLNGIASGLASAGIEVTGAAGIWEVSNNDISNATNGMRFNDSSFYYTLTSGATKPGIFKMNKFQNLTGYGVQFTNGTEATAIMNNQFDGVGKGIQITNYASAETIKYNTVWNSDMGIILEADYDDFDVWYSGEVGGDATNYGPYDIEISVNQFNNVDVAIGVAGLELRDIVNNAYQSVGNALVMFNSMVSEFSGSVANYSGTKASYDGGLVLYKSSIDRLADFELKGSFPTGVYLTENSVLANVDGIYFEGGDYGIQVENSLLGTVSNSIFNQNGYGVYADGATDAFTVMYSTFYDYTNGAIASTGVIPGGNLEIVNNVFSKKTSTATDVAVFGTADIGVLDYNLYDDAVAGTSRFSISSGVVSYTYEELEPLFGFEVNGYLDAGSSLSGAPANFDLDTKSYGLNTAGSSYVVGLDYYGASRPVCGGYDRGAAERSLGSDNDGDGLCANQEAAWGTSDSSADSDGDGDSDYDEIYVLGTDPTYGGPANDADLDGMDDDWEDANGLDSTVDDSGDDPDGDGLSNLEEYEAGTDPQAADSDGDGLSDGDELLYGSDPWSVDSDGDGLEDGEEVDTYGTDPTSADSDGDGLSDDEEIFTYETDPNDSDTDDDRLEDGEEIDTYGTDPLVEDSDGDSFKDGIEVLAGSDPNDAGSTPDTIDTDGDGMLDWWEIYYGLDETDASDAGDDADADDLTNLEEYESSTDPTDDDCDDDGLLDGEEVNDYGTDPWDTDSDNDGINDGAEVDGSTGYVSDPADADTDGDGLSDGDEIDGFYGYESDPTTEYSDSDSLSDYDEVMGTSGYVTDPMNEDTDGDNIDDDVEIAGTYSSGAYVTDPTKVDTDGDGYNDDEEQDGILNVDGTDTYYTDPTNEDTDGDLINDGDEIDGTYTYDSNPTTDQSDADGISDFDEVMSTSGYVTDPMVDDTDGDGYDDDVEIDTGYDPTDPSSYPTDLDGDGMDDSWETTYGLDTSYDDSAEDLDGDGYTNLEEYVAGTDPQDAAYTPDDVDGDGMDDAWETTYGLDTSTDDSGDDLDGDGYTNLEEYVAGTDPSDSSKNPGDTDSDGMPDSWETTYGLDTSTDDSGDDADGDGLTNYEEYVAGTDPTDEDTDGDLFRDDYEVSEGSDPSDASDMPTLALEFVGHKSFFGYGDSSAWNDLGITAYPYSTSITLDVDASLTMWVEVYLSNYGALGLAWDEDEYLGSVTVEYCGTDGSDWDPRSASCVSIGTYGAAADPNLEATLVTSSSQFEIWSDLSPYYSFASMTWYRPPLAYGFAYDAFSIELTP